MKSGIVLFFLCLLFFCNSFGQKASYSHQAVRIGYQDFVQLIANVSSRHHLLLIRPKKPPVIYVYDESLRLLGKKEIPVPVPNNSDVQLLSFRNQYFFYVHIPKTYKYQLWRIDPNGNVKDMLPLFRNLVDSNFKDSSATVQVMADADNFYLRTQVYYPQLGKLKLSMITTDTLLNSRAVDHISFPFNSANENLQQVTILDKEHLLILKRITNDDAENLLEVMKCNFKSGHTSAIQFNVNYRLFSQPVMHFNPNDSTILVYSMVREPLLNQGVNRSLFLCKLNKTLQPVGQVTSLKMPDLFSFFLISDLNMNWLHFIDGRLGLYKLGSYSNSGVRKLYESYINSTYNYNLQQMYEGYDQNEIYNSNNKVKFSILDQHFKVVSDTSMLIDNKKFIVRVSNFGKFQWRNRSYMIMEQQLPNKSTGLFLVSSKEHKSVNVSDLPVYNRYNYFLSKLQLTSDGSVIIPYANKEQLGLMKLKLD